MPIELTPDVGVRRDENGKVRQLQHLGRPYRADSVLAMLSDAVATTPRSLAEAYLRDTAEVFGLVPSSTENFTAALSDAPTQAPVELRFKEEKSAGAAVTVSYDQTVLGLPIWNAGMSVRVDAKQMHVTGSHNATHYEVDAIKPPPDAEYLPHRMAPETVARVLGLDGVGQLVVNATRALIFFYDPADRLDPQAKADEEPDEMTGFDGGASQPVPTLPLPPVPDDVKGARHYVVTEVLFSLPAEHWGPLNWRAFVEPATGAVLYLRALVACARGQVFTANPVDASGQPHGADDPVAVLDGMKATVALFGLGAPAPTGQALEGEYVRLVEIEQPGKPMPKQTAPFDFFYGCDTPDFAACNAYHHCDAFFRLIEGLGLDVASYFNNTDFPVPVDPHAFGGQVNAAAPGNVAGNGLGRLVFGLAKADTTFGIAADPRVVIHEFGHAVLWDHVDSPNFGWAHSPGDSLAVILHDPYWTGGDRFDTFPFMNRSAGLARRHDRDVAEGWAWGGARDNRQYGSEQILSTTLFRVYRIAGGDSADQPTREFASRYLAYLILKAVGLLSFTTTDPDVYVTALAEADAGAGLFEGHPGGAFAKVFRWSFEQQGLYQPPGAPEPVAQAGAPPDVDVYIDDGRAGGYMPYREDFEGDAEIWNRLAADGGLQNEPPAVAAQNFAYVRVGNRGTNSATGLAVRGFKSKAAGARNWPTDWKALTTPRITVPGALAPGAEVVVGPFAWTPAFDGESLMFEASAQGDRSTLELVTAGPILNSRLVPLDNNLAQRTFKSGQ